VTYACMPGAPYTGSTLLGFLLNCHPDCASIGAATGLIESTDLSTYRCSCGQLFLECEFWTHVARKTRDAGHPVNVHSTGFWDTRHGIEGPRWLNAALLRSLPQPWATRLRDATIGRLPIAKLAVKEAGWKSWALADAVLAVTGTSVFVDTARDRDRPALLSQYPELDMRAIHLVRDVRGNTASMLKHGIVKNAAAAARFWKRANRGARRACQAFAPGRYIQVRYDVLCSDVQGTLDRLADFLSIPRSLLPADFRSTKHHIIGNAMRLASSAEVRPDDSWKNRLSEQDLAQIARIAGQTNRDFGFDWPADDI